MERKLAAILCADVAGYSRLMGQNEEATLATLTSHRKIIDSLIEQYRGRFVNSAGDSVLAEFASVVEAVNCAVAVQKALRTENAGLPETRRMEFRIGVNLGDVIIEGGQIYGDGVNVAARLESLAEPGGICVSGVVHDQVRDKLEFGFQDRGEQAVKNIARPVHVWSVVPDGAKAAAPSLTQRIPQRYWRSGILSVTGLVIIVATIVLVQHISLKPPHTSASIPPNEKPALPMPTMASIAVLPFNNMSGNPDQEYFSDGLTDNLITRLSALPGVLVIARNSSFFYKGKAATVQQVGRELGVRTILQGSVMRTGNRVRVNAELADATTDSNLWAQSFDQPLKDIFTIQDEIVLNIVKTLSAFFKLDNLQVPRSITLEDKPTDNIEAWDDTLQGAHGFWEFTAEGNARARQMWEKAVSLDPNYAEAYAALGWTYSMDILSGRSRNVHRDLARSSELARKALSIDDSTVLALALLSRNDYLEGRFDQAVDDARKIFAVNPNSAMGYSTLAQALSADDRPKEAIVAIQKVVRLDPAARNYYNEDLGWTYLHLGQWQEAIAAFEQYANSYPQDVNGHNGLTMAYSELGWNKEAQAQIAEVKRLDPQYSMSKLGYKGSKDKAFNERFVRDLRKAGLN